MDFLTRSTVNFGALFVYFCLGNCALLAAPAPEPLVLVIPHTHWEGAVFKTREEYLEIGLPNIEKALYLLKKYPQYRFVLDQMCYVRPFLERYPADVEAFRRFVAEGRLQIVGGTDTMHDNNIPSGESIARQYLYSKLYFRDALHDEVTTGWALDTFGHNAQMPQMLKLAGMKSYWFQRGVPDVNTPSEFLWKGIDGTEIPAFWLPLSYAPIQNVSANELEFSRLMEGLFDRLTPFSRGNARVLLAGADVWEPEELLPIMVEKFERANAGPFKLQLATPVDFEREVAKRSDRPVIVGELNPVFQGVYSSRIEIKQAMRETERLLTTAEKLSAIAEAFGAPRDAGTMARAWEPLLFNEAHDLSSGVMVDKVYEDSLERYSLAQHLGGDLIRANLQFIEERANTAGMGVPVAVFNTLGWRRTDAAEVDVAFSDPGVQSFALVDAQGSAVPIQFLKTLRNDDGGIRQARIAFLARNIPALGYAIYHAVPNRPGAPSAAQTVHSSMHEDQAVMENEFYRASFDLWTGEMKNLTLKKNNWDALAGSGNVVAREYDGGDFWELYGTLNGARLTAMKKPILAPRPAYTEWSRDFVGGTGTVTCGPVFCEFHIAHPFGKNQFATQVRMYKGLRRIDIKTDLTNQEELVRYRAVFPTSISSGTVMEEIPFGAIERPERQEFPAQNWIDYSDASKGISLINRGLPGNNVTEGKMMLSLMRSTHLLSYGFIGGYEPGVSSDTGLGIGKKYSLDYALLPHSGNWQAAEPWRAGLEFNNPLLAESVSPHAGSLAAAWGMLDVSADDVVVSALKPGRKGETILRVYEAAGKEARGVQIEVHLPINGLHEANLIEDPGESVNAPGNTLRFDLRPFEIKTFSFRVEAAFAGNVSKIGSARSNSEPQPRQKTALHRSRNAL